MSGRGKQHQVREDSGDKARKPFWRRARNLGGMMLAGAVFTLFAVGLFASLFPQQASAAQDPGGGSADLKTACNSLGKGAEYKEKGAVHQCVIAKPTKSQDAAIGQIPRTDPITSTQSIGPSADDKQYIVEHANGGYVLMPYTASGGAAINEAALVTAIMKVAHVASDPKATPAPIVCYKRDGSKIPGTTDGDCPVDTTPSPPATPEKDCYKSDGSKAKSQGGKCPAGTTDTPPKPGSDCQVEGVGWLICPVAKFLGGAADKMYGTIGGFLNINPSMFTQGQPAEQSYQSMLPLANVVLVILFLAVIYSEATGVGSGSGMFSNYNIKKMLPRLLIFAVLMNISWYICAAAVDLSNIVGANANSFFKSQLPNGVQTVNPSSFDTGSGATGFWGSTIAIVLAGAAAILFVGPTVILTLIIAVIVILLMMFFILIVRQAAVVLLCVVSPLAFAMAILPNTKKVFDKWRSMFTSMLMVYPIIGATFGASALAGTILMSQNTQSGITPGDPGWWMQIAGAACMVVPLVAVPMILKGSLNGLGKIGAALGGFAAGRMSGRVGKVKAKAKSGYQESIGRQAGLKLKSGAAKRYSALGTKLSGTGKFGGAVATGLGMNSRGTARVAAAGATEARRRHDDDVKSATAMISDKNWSQDELVNQMTSGKMSQTELEAANALLDADTMSPDQALKLANFSNTLKPKMGVDEKGNKKVVSVNSARRAIMATVAKSKELPLKGGDAGKIGVGMQDYDAHEMGMNFTDNDKGLNSAGKLAAITDDQLDAIKADPQMNANLNAALALRSKDVSQEQLAGANPGIGDMIRNQREADAKAAAAAAAPPDTSQFEPNADLAHLEALNQNGVKIDHTNTVHQRIIGDAYDNGASVHDAAVAAGVTTQQALEAINADHYRKNLVAGPGAKPLSTNLTGDTARMHNGQDNH